MDREQMKKRAIAQADCEREAILALGDTLYKNPETGFREVKSTEIAARALEALGLRVDREIAVTGCRAYANPERDGIKLAVMGELDSVVCPEHPDSDPVTGAVHACGHNIQTAVMYGVAAALIRSGVMEQLDGSVDFIAVPAEEGLELGYRQGLREQGRLSCYSGKQELIARGAFDNTDICMMAHNFPIARQGLRVYGMNSGNGFFYKRIRFIGRQAHAGATPWEGINALNMATVALNSIQMQRETFKDSDHVRVHQIITNGGQMVNAVPAEVCTEGLVRAATIEAVMDASAKVNRSVQGAAIALGGNAEVCDTPGYLPMRPDEALARLFEENAARFYAPEQIAHTMESTASFDMGDLSQLMPVLHCITSGVEGGLHAGDYRISDVEDAYITPVKILACTVIDLLWNGAEGARAIKAGFKPALTKSEYLQALSEMEQRYRY